MNPRHLSRGEFLSLTSLLAGSSLLPRPAEAAPKPSERLGFEDGCFMPYVASVAMRLDDVLGRIPWPVQTNLFRIFLRGDPAAFSRQRDRIAREDSIWLANGFSQTRVPGVVETELQVGEGLTGLDDAQAVRAFLRLLEPA